MNLWKRTKTGEIRGREATSDGSTVCTLLLLLLCYVFVCSKWDSQFEHKSSARVGVGVGGAVRGEARRSSWRKLVAMIGKLGAGHLATGKSNRGKTHLIDI